MEGCGKRFLLMCPGPVNVAGNVAKSMISSEVGHREREFSETLSGIRHMTLELMGLPEDAYDVVVITGSGSAGNEAVITSAIRPEDRVLTIETGEFGRRLGEISRIYNPNTESIVQEWGEPLDMGVLEERLAGGKFDWVLTVHHETSTGDLMPVDEIGGLCARYGARLFVDAVSSFMVDPLDLAASGVDFMSTSSGKGLGMCPGLSIVVGKKSEFARLSSYPVRNYYLSLARHHEYMTSKLQTPNTPGIALFFALHEALVSIAREGLANRYAWQAAKTAVFRKGLEDIGLKLLHPDHVLSNAVSSILLPAGVSFAELRDHLRARGIIVYGGKGPLADRIFQVSTMGAVTERDIRYLLDSLAEFLMR